MRKRRMELARRRFRFYTIMSVVALTLTVKTYQGLNIKKQTAVAENSVSKVYVGTNKSFDGQTNMHIFKDGELYALNSIDDIPANKTFKKKIYNGNIVFTEVIEDEKEGN